MAWRLEPDRPLPQELKRVAREQAASAIQQLEGKGDPNRDVAIHEARKSIKKIRGLLRMLRPELD